MQTNNFTRLWRQPQLYHIKKRASDSSLTIHCQRTRNHERMVHHQHKPTTERQMQQHHAESNQYTWWDSSLLGDYIWPCQLVPWPWKKYPTINTENIFRDRLHQRYIRHYRLFLTYIKRYPSNLLKDNNKKSRRCLLSICFDNNW